MERRSLLIALLAGMGLINLLLFTARFSNNHQEVTSPPQIERPENPTPPEEPEPPVQPKLEDALNSITSAELKEHVVYLASDELKGREPGLPGGDAARDYIKKELEEDGLPTEFDTVAVMTGDRSSENVYAYMLGTKLPNEIVVIGAHYDHLGVNRRGQVFHGADDNASGTSAVLEIAQGLAQLKGQNKRTILFQLYTGEEQGLLGSKQYCAHPTFPKDHPSIKAHVAMINLDMIGYLQQQAFLAEKVWLDSPDLQQIVQILSSKYPFATRITSHGARGGGSDHAPFNNAGVPVVFLHTGLHRDYHEPSDTADKLNYGGMEMVAKYGLEIAWRVCQSDVVPQKTAGTMSETHDHDYSESPFPK